MTLTLLGLAPLLKLDRLFPVRDLDVSFDDRPFRYGDGTTREAARYLRRSRDFDALSSDDVAFYGAGDDDVVRAKGPFPVAAFGERNGPVDVAVSLDSSAEYVASLA